MKSVDASPPKRITSDELRKLLKNVDDESVVSDENVDSLLRDTSAKIFRNPAAAVENLEQLTPRKYLRGVLPNLMTLLNSSQDPDARLCNLVEYVDKVSSFRLEHKGIEDRYKDQDFLRACALDPLNIVYGTTTRNMREIFDVITNPRLIVALDDVFKGGMRLCGGYEGILRENPAYIKKWCENPAVSLRDHILSTSNLGPDHVLTKINEVQGYRKSLDLIHDGVSNSSGVRPFEGHTLYLAGGAGRVLVQKIAEINAAGGGGSHLIQTTYDPREAWFTAYEMQLNGVDPERVFGGFREVREYSGPLSGLTLGYGEGRDRLLRGSVPGEGSPIGSSVPERKKKTYVFGNVAFVGCDALMIGRGSTVEQYIRELTPDGRLDTLYTHDSENWLFDQPTYRTNEREKQKTWIEENYPQFYENLTSLLKKDGFMVVSLSDERLMTSAVGDDRFMEVTPESLKKMEVYRDYLGDPPRMHVAKPLEYGRRTPPPISVGGFDVEYPENLQAIRLSNERNFRVFIKTAD